nr:ABC transporter substrate-binding protein [Celerinatantimonas diazotrophica]
MYTTQASANTPVAIGISGWTGFGPLVLADKAGIFKKNGVDVDLKMIPQKDRLLSIASGSLQCAATTVETYIPWDLRVHLKQIVMLDKSYGADGLAVRNGIKSFKDLKGKTIGVDAKGTTSYFTLAWMLKKNGMSMKDVQLNTMSPSAAAQAFVAGQNDAAMTYEPYLSEIRDHPKAGHILATTLQYPIVMDSLGCQSDWLKKHPKAAQALVNSYFDALKMIHKQPKKSYAIMGSVVKQTGPEFAQSAKYLRWQTKADNRQFFHGVLQNFSKQAGKIMLEEGIVPRLPKIEDTYDGQFIK